MRFNYFRIDESAERPRIRRCLVVVDFESLTTSTVARHVAALRDESALFVEVCHIGVLNWYPINLDRFDVVVIHYSVAIAQGHHIRNRARALIRSCSSLKIHFIQDEYRWIDATAKAMGDLGISVIFSVANKEAVHAIYHHAWLNDVRKEITLTGFVDESLLAIDVPRYEERKTDVAYRARKVPFWLGRLGMEKSWIGERFLSDATRYGLHCDISSDETARMYGSEWNDFVGNAKAVLGTESGASVCDFSGGLQTMTDTFVSANPDASFDSVFNSVLRNEDGRVVIHVISPRIFEAAALRTLMVNYPGDYSGRLIAWRHYVPLEKDHSNMEEVVKVIRDPERAKKIIEAAYVEVACNPDNSFRAMVAHFDRVVSEELRVSLHIGSIPKRHAPKFRALEWISWFDVYARYFKRHLITLRNMSASPFRFR